MTLKYITFICSLAFCVLSANAQSYSEIGNLYHLQAHGDKQAVSGFIQFNGMTDENVYANALLWVVENICPQLQEGITEISIPSRKFSCQLSFESSSGAKQKSIYYANATFRVTDSKLIYHLTDIMVESNSLIIKKITPIEKLTPEKKLSHKQMTDGFVQLSSNLLNQLFDFVGTHQLMPITHWKDISIRRPVKGMTEDECRLAFGKPQSVMDTNGEVQWMYSTSFYLFFKNGRVNTIIK
ncbi:MAG: hypothetical protein K2L60_03065 [Bacteroides sp.]|nr:hypothetical protein [Bacteroides sp.]